MPNNIIFRSVVHEEKMFKCYFAIYVHIKLYPYGAGSYMTQRSSIAQTLISLSQGFLMFIQNAFWPVVQSPSHSLTQN